MVAASAHLHIAVVALEVTTIVQYCLSYSYIPLGPSYDICSRVIVGALHISASVLFLFYRASSAFDPVVALEDKIHGLHTSMTCLKARK